jgi:uncharacterized protein (TIGR02246 family)
MKMRLSCLVLPGLAILLASLNACKPHVSSPASSDREAAAAIMQEVDMAWNARDAARFSAVFVEDGNFQFPVEGIALRGRDEIRRHYAKLFATVPPDLRHVSTIGEIDAIGPGILAVAVQVDILAIDPKTGAAQTLLHYDGLGLGVRTDPGWRIRLACLYPVAKSPAAAPPAAK